MDDVRKRDLEDGYYFSYQEKPNGRGGFHPVNLTLNHDASGLHEKITDSEGWFLNFPGVVDGDWQNKLTHPFREKMEFVYGVKPTSQGGWEFFWEVQPDGMYYMDDDGFGMENDIEIQLMSYMDRHGRFICPFYLRP